MPKALKNRASKQGYVSPSQLTLAGFETPFSKELNPENRWVVLAHKIPWDPLVCVYLSQMNNDDLGAEGINPRVVIGSMIIKHICNLSDKETVMQIQENIYMQYFIGYSSFSDEEPFDPSLFVSFRKRLGIEQINEINERILGLSREKEPSREPLPDKESINEKSESGSDPEANVNVSEAKEEPIVNVSESDVNIQEPTVPVEIKIPHKGKLIVDATACPQDISYPTDLNLLNDARKKSEALIDHLYNQSELTEKPRTYRKEARKNYLKTAQKKTRTKKEIRKAIKKQLSYVSRNIKSIYKLLDEFDIIPLDPNQYKYLLVIQTLYEQQLKMYNEKTHSVNDRIVSIHQPHVRPMVRGKTNANVEFGAKIQVSIVNGYAFLEEFSWDAFNESTCLMQTIENYKRRMGCYPEEVAVDKIYCTRENRAKIKKLGIALRAKPLGRPKAVDIEHVRPGERNPIEGKFGQAKTTYGLNRIKARLAQTSESWIATIIMVLNLVKLTGEVPYLLFLKLITYSALSIKKRIELCILKVKPAWVKF